MIDQLISFPTAIVAKEKGFNLFTNAAYNKLNGLLIGIYEESRTIIIPAPTQSLLHSWLIQNHKLFVEITIEAFKDGYNWNVQIIDLDFDNSEKTDDWKETGKRSTGQWGDNGEFNSYEEALEFGLQEALKLIK